MGTKFVNEGGINGSGKGLVNINSKDFKALQSAIKQHAAGLSDKQKRENILLSVRFQLVTYLEAENTEIKALGLFIKEIVKELNIKNKDFAEYLEYKPSNISAFLNGKRKVNHDLVIKIGRIFNLNPILLLNVQSKNELIKTQEKNKEKYMRYNIDDLLKKVG